MEFTDGELLDLREATYAAAKLERVRAEVEAWRDEALEEYPKLDKTHNWDEGTHLKGKAQAFCQVLDLLDGETDD